MFDYEEKRCQDIANALNMNVGDVRELMKKQEKNRLLNLHPYKIYQGKDGKWYTYLPDRVKGRVFKKRKTQNEIEDLVIEYWKENEKNPTVKELFNEWIEEKRKLEEISIGTKNRYESQFEQCFSAIEDLNVKSITKRDIIVFVKSTVHDCRLTAKGFSNFRTLLYGIFRLASEKDLVDYSITQIMADIKISDKSFRKVEKSDEDEVFMIDEFPKIIEYLEKNPDILNLGLLILLVTGLRIGELAALKWCDIIDNAIYVNRTEIRYKDESGNVVYEVSDCPKTVAGMRKAVIPSKYLWVVKKIKMLNPFGEYVFMKSDKRIRNYIFRRRLSKVCKYCNVKEKSPHKARKTYATILLDEGIPESVIINLMGHTDIVTTKKHYQRNRQHIEQITNILDKVSSL